MLSLRQAGIAATRLEDGPDPMDIRALARHLDLSIGTVSRALNGRKDVREATRVRVLEAVAALGYVPNQAGQTLRRGQTRPSPSC